MPDDVPANHGPVSDDLEAPTVEIVLHPAGEPRPALKYQLLPPFLERRPGNAVVHYLKAPHENYRLFSDGEYWDTICKWIEMPLPELRDARDKNARVALNAQGIIQFLEQGARCESCDWDLRIREHGLFLLLPEIQSARAPARILAARARLQIADGKFDEAVRTLQTGYAFARHVGQGPTLVQGLVGVMNAGSMSKQVETLLQQPGAPNLYWALASLPRPLIDFRTAYEAEMLTAYFTFPELCNLDTKDYAPEHWQRLLEQTNEKIRQLVQSGSRKSEEKNKPSDKERFQTLATAVDVYPRAKRMLVAEGRTVEEVEAMSVHQVLMLYTVRRFEELRDNMFKWMWMPFASINQYLKDAHQRFLRSLSSDPEVIPIVGTLLPAIVAAKSAEARADRDLAALQILEAIRLYGAAHEGRLPERLADITEVPIPLDPMHGGPFRYLRDGDTAILESTCPTDPPQPTLRYRIRFDSKGGKP